MDPAVPPGRQRPASGAAARRPLTWAIAALLATAVLFRVLWLGTTPGVSGDEGWWGIQALAWLSGESYETHTTSGNPIDPFLLIPVALAHTLAPPSFPLLRAVPALANLLALPMAFWLVRRAYGSTTAWVHTVGLAVMPTAIAHGRICQDPSQTVFWTGLVVYLSLLGLANRARAWVWLGAAVSAFPIALWTHPTNVFIAPFLMLPLSAAIAPWLPPTRRGRAMVGAVAAVGAGLALALSAAAVRQLAGSNDYLDRPWLSLAASRLTDGAQWFEFAANNARLLNGVTVYHYFSGARPWTAPYDAVVVLAVGAAGAGLFLLRPARRSALDYGLLGACAATWLLFYAFAGPDALRPHFERWGLCLIVPATLVLARGFTGWVERTPAIGRWSAGAAAALAAAALATFYVNYFREFSTTGGRSHLTYVTAAVEPKRQALEHILAAGGSAPVVIVAQQWWLARPIAYLAAQRTNVTVSRTLDRLDDPAARQALDDGRLFFVEFSGTPELEAVAAWLRERGAHGARTIVHDASGRALIEILRATRR